MSQGLRRPGTCAFCGAQDPSSREHTFAKWMTQFIPVSDLTKHEIVATRHPTNFCDEPIPATRRKNDGPPTSRRQPIVCLACNNGWMSQLEESVKPILGPMLQGTPTVLDPANQRLLARWIDKTIMVYEFEFPDNTGTSSEQRRTFMNRDDPNNDTRVWIGHFTGESDYPRPRHHAWGPRDVGTGQTLRQRVDTITMGQVIFYVTSATMPELVVEDYPASALSDYLTPIWPITHESVTWPPPSAINGIQHRWLADWRITDLISEMPGYPPQLPKSKISIPLWKRLKDEDNLTDKEMSENAPIEPGWDAFREATRHHN